LCGELEWLEEDEDLIVPAPSNATRQSSTSNPFVVVVVVVVGPEDPTHLIS
jgi:hypothetical protein